MQIFLDSAFSHTMGTEIRDGLGSVSLSNLDRQALVEGKLLARIFSAERGDVENIKLTLPVR